MKINNEDILKKAIKNHKSGNLKKAEFFYTGILKSDPNHPHANHNMGLIAFSTGKEEESLNLFQTALKVNPSIEQFWYSYIKALLKLDRLEEAKSIIFQCKEALKNNKKFIVKLERDFLAPIYNNLSFAMKTVGKLSDAINYANQAIKINPNLSEAYNNLGVALQENGNLNEAIESYYNASIINSDFKQAIFNMGNVLEKIQDPLNQPLLTKICLNILDEKTYSSPRDIADIILTLLKSEPKIKTIINYKNIDFSTSIKISKIISELGRIPLLIKFMKLCPIPDIELENLFTNIRSNILIHRKTIKGSYQKTNFLKGLVLQCFTNEYLYNETKEDTINIQKLEKTIESTLKSGNQPRIFDLLCLASFRYLHLYGWCKDLEISNEFDEIYKSLILNPYYERKLAFQIPIINQLKNKVSEKVANQYEHNPYPRWINIKLNVEASTISKIVAELGINLFDESIKKVTKPNILIAGCGTGHHSIRTAARFIHSNITAIDLSLPSLAYAKRKSKEFNFKDIEYLKCDVLDLKQLNQKFDVIECLGVLHHMDDPIKGWRILTSCLKPKGLMRIGLYSEYAREKVIQFRKKYIYKQNKFTNKQIKEIRKELIKNHYDKYYQIIKSQDFYSFSEIRDLLFHVKEHQFTLPKIDKILSKLGLRFCGFENPIAVEKFRLYSKNRNDIFNLSKWDTFEKKNPQIFSGMYQFWCQQVF